MGLVWKDDGNDNPSANALTPDQALELSGWGAESLLRSIQNGQVDAVRINGQVRIDGRSLWRAMGRGRPLQGWDEIHRMNAEQRAYEQELRDSGSPLYAPRTTTTTPEERRDAGDEFLRKFGRKAP
ncbi:MAG TPA: hypothetical protein VKA15_16385 [Isosphaeraceae bacterium]|nr:hypothetical protein [Isosphaeraceae bacterium]